MTTTRRPLTADERRYLSSTRTALRGVARTTRQELLATLTENLLDRPPTEGRDALEAALGTPAEYAGRLLEEADAARPGVIARSRRRHRHHLSVVATAAVAVLVAALVGYQKWDTWQVGVIPRMQGVCEGDQVSRTGCGTTLFTALPAPSGTYLAATCIPGATFILQLDVGTSRPVDVTAVDFPQAAGTGGGTVIRLDDVTAHARISAGDAAATMVPFPVPLGPDDSKGYELRLHFTMVCTFDGVSPGSDLVFTTYRVHYRALGKERVQDLPLMMPLQITLPRT